ncbi:MAG: catalase [Rhodoferax sp.]|nr:catalase [Rhodoferax sp.]
MGLSAISLPVSHFAAANAKVHAAEPLAAAAKDASGSDAPANPAAARSPGPSQLSQEALAQLSKLKARDTQVRQHEAAHLAAAGGLATSGASYSYQKGPDGVSYAIGGEVGIDVSPGSTPSETIGRARTIQAAALAPADPSGQDLAVAAQARQMEQNAHGELAQQQNDLAKSAQQQAASVNRAYGSSDSRPAPSLSVFA